MDAVAAKLPVACKTSLADTGVMLKAQITLCSMRINRYPCVLKHVARAAFSTMIATGMKFTALGGRGEGSVIGRTVDILIIHVQKTRVDSLVRSHGENYFFL
jgi:hypothetical protein